ncbi:MAG: phosphoserine phosphatase SerB [Pseudomonadota bacterium]
MHIATLIAPPGRLDPALVEALSNAWAGGDTDWLSPGEAAEFPLADVPQNLADVSADIRAQGTDLVVQPAEDRRKYVLLADMDSTMIGQECIDELAEVAGVGGAVREITARAMNGELDFEEALLARVELLKGLDLGVIDTVLAERITLTPGGRTLVATMRANGGYAALVSGGFTSFTQAIASKLGFDENRANTLLAENGRLTGDVARPILGQDAKVAALMDICARLGLPESAVLAVGDGANDLGMIARAGAGVALHAKPVVADAAPIRIDHGDLTALLYLQGYARDEFVTS